MKKILFSLVALVCSMSMNAQVIKIYEGETLKATYAGLDYRVVFDELFTTGTATRTGNIGVKWVQLWENGPKFAEYNVGAANNKAEDYGCYYAWGGNQDMIDDHNTGTKVLSGKDDTATNLWGSNWRMPTKEEFTELINNCDHEWTTVNGVRGRKFTGRGDYASNSVFLPAAGYCSDGGINGQGSYVLYWSSSPNGSNSAYHLRFVSGNQEVRSGNRVYRYSVRAVLAE